MCRDVASNTADLCLGYCDNLIIYTVHLLPEESEPRRFAFATPPPSGQRE